MPKVSRSLVVGLCLALAWSRSTIGCKEKPLAQREPESSAKTPRPKLVSDGNGTTFASDGAERFYVVSEPPNALVVRATRIDDKRTRALGTIRVRRLPYVTALRLVGEHLYFVAGEMGNPGTLYEVPMTGGAPVIRGEHVGATDVTSKWIATVKSDFRGDKHELSVIPRVGDASAPATFALQAPKNEIVSGVAIDDGAVFAVSFGERPDGKRDVRLHRGDVGAPKHGLEVTHTWACERAAIALGSAHVFALVWASIEKDAGPPALYAIDKARGAKAVKISSTPESTAPGYGDAMRYEMRVSALRRIDGPGSFATLDEMRAPAPDVMTLDGVDERGVLIVSGDNEQH